MAFFDNVCLLAKNRRVKRSVTPVEGGHFAIVGFIQQMLGSAAAFVRCISRDANGGQAVFEIEAYGQDQSITSVSSDGAPRRVFRQYKVSSTNRKITATDATEIVNALQASREMADHREKLETAFELCTNQQPSGPAAKVLRDSGVAMIDHDPTQAQQELRTYAAQFGVMGERELQKGIDAVIGHFFFLGATSSSRQITKTALDEVLTGFASPGSLIIPDACSTQRTELEREATRLLPVGAFLARRMKIIETIQTWENAALVILVGEGGCGKTTALVQLLRDVLNGEGMSQALACLWLPSLMAPQTLATQVATWRGAPLPSNSEAASDDALKRLCYANPRRQPVMILGLDGIDEIQYTDPWYANATQVVNFFWRLHEKHSYPGSQPPPARLVVTCRRRDEFKKILTPPSGLQSFGPAVNPRFVDIGEFSKPELDLLLEGATNLDARVKQLILDAREETPSADYEDPVTADPNAIGFVRSRWPRLVRRPVIWRFFNSLDAGDQLNLLLGESADREMAEDRIARRYLQWFLVRVEQRRRVDKRAALDALVAIAQGYGVEDGPHGLDRWIETGIRLGIGNHGARALFDESIMVGIIGDIRGGAPSVALWRWQEEFIWKYLRKGAGELYE